MLPFGVLVESTAIWNSRMTQKLLQIRVCFLVRHLLQPLHHVSSSSSAYRSACVIIQATGISQGAGSFQHLRLKDMS